MKTRPVPRRSFRDAFSTRRGGVVLLATGLLAGGAFGQSSDFELPGPESIERLAPLVGDWSMTGVTAEGQEGVPGGRPFTARQQVEWIDEGRALSVNWSVSLESGRTIAEGRGRIGWDDIAEAVVNTYRGEESGRRFTGSATLIAADADDALFDWRGHETAGTSSSVNFEVTYIFPDGDTCLVDFIPTCIDGQAGLDPARFSWKRVDPFDAAMPMARSLVGDWRLVSGASEDFPAGSRAVIRKGRGNRSLLIMMEEESVDGEVGEFIFSDVTWLDETAGELRQRWTDARGRRMMGTSSAAERNGVPAWRVVWKPLDDLGRPLDVPVFQVSWLTLSDGRLEVSYTAVDREGREVDAPSIAPSTIWERVSR